LNIHQTTPKRTPYPTQTAYVEPKSVSLWLQALYFCQPFRERLLDHYVTLPTVRRRGCGIHVVATSSPRRRHVVATSSPRPRHVANALRTLASSCVELI